ncbi:Cell division protein FtsQ [Anaplasma phagocytophilum]|uniref:cell division protein FtsQ/DivIB n=1 Tax=Anaplasma phagocytophilum TaxID=948 RepID=UPI0007DEB33F|nr:cell division protein FtsQ/DivIB [Anaplasma phagocytophilum]SCV62200.1 Cell division protein FtsQ [Anaplasma phagocytophilum]
MYKFVVERYNAILTCCRNLLRRLVRFWLYAAIVGVLALATLLGAVSVAISGKDVFRAFSDMLVKAGLPIREVVIKGNHMAQPNDVLYVIDNERSIVLLGLEDLKMRIKHRNPWIKDVAITRLLHSGVLNINVKEYEAFANWNHHGVNSIIDNTGHVIVNSVPRFSNLVSICCDDAKEDLHFVRAILDDDSALVAMVSSLFWVEGKRWDVDLSSGLRIKLPEDNPVEAWFHLMKEYPIFDNFFIWKEIDMRDANDIRIK